MPVDDERVIGVLDGAREGAVRRVVLEQEGVQARLYEVVDGHDLNVGGALEDGLQGLAADAAEPVDPDANGHGGNLHRGAVLAAMATGQAPGLDTVFGTARV